MDETELTEEQRELVAKLATSMAVFTIQRAMAMSSELVGMAQKQTQSIVNMANSLTNAMVCESAAATRANLERGNHDASNQ